MRASRRLVPCAIILVLLAGCIDASPPLTPVDETPWVFEWSPDPDLDTAGWMIEIETGSAECTYEADYSGRFTHPAGLGAFRAHFTENSTLRSSTIRVDDTIHVGPLNSGHYSGPVWGAGFEYAGWSRVVVENWTTATFITALFHFLPAETWLRLQCTNQDFVLRFFEADALDPIQSTTASGGVGLNVQYMDTVMVGMNQHDKYSIETGGDRVYFFIHEGLGSGLLIDPEVEGRLTFRWPGGEETHDWSDLHWSMERLLAGKGTYELDLNRVAINYDYMRGILLGFEATLEHG